MEQRIRTRVHELYWDHDVNCARTSLLCLDEIFRAGIEEQTLRAAIGLHGARFRAAVRLWKGRDVSGLLFREGKTVRRPRTAVISRRIPAGIRAPCSAATAAGGFPQRSPASLRKST